MGEEDDRLPERTAGVDDGVRKTKDNQKNHAVSLTVGISGCIRPYYPHPTVVVVTREVVRIRFPVSLAYASPANSIDVA